MQTETETHVITLIAATKQELLAQAQAYCAEHAADGLFTVVRAPYYDRKSVEYEKWTTEMSCTPFPTRPDAEEIPPMASPVTRACANCGREVKRLTTGRCESCYRYFRKHGRERIVAGVAAANTGAEDVGQEAVDAQVEPESQVAREELPEPTSHVIIVDRENEAAWDVQRAAGQQEERRPQPGQQLPRPRRLAYELSETTCQAILADRQAGLSYAKIDAKHHLLGIAKTPGHIAWTVCKRAAKQAQMMEDD